MTPIHHAAALTARRWTQRHQPLGCPVAIRCAPLERAVRETGWRVNTVPFPPAWIRWVGYAAPRVLWLNAASSSAWRRVALAHLLGHLWCHPQHPGPEPLTIPRLVQPSSLWEAEAYGAATALLIPDCILGSVSPAARQRAVAMRLHVPDRFLVGAIRDCGRGPAAAPAGPPCPRLRPRTESADTAHLCPLVAAPAHLSPPSAPRDP